MACTAAVIFSCFHSHMRVCLSSFMHAFGSSCRRACAAHTAHGVSGGGRRGEGDAGALKLYVDPFSLSSSSKR